MILGLHRCVRKVDAIKIERQTIARNHSCPYGLQLTGTVISICCNW